MKIFKNVIAYFATMAAIVSLAIPLMAPVAVNAQTSPLPTDQYCYTFTTNLGEGRSLSQADADALRIALTNAGVWNDSDITTYNDAVASAVSGFQEKYAAQILTPNGLSYGTGFVGASTRNELNSLSGCPTPTRPVQSTQCPAGYTCTPINQNPAPVCPAGWTCMPITTNPTQPTSPTNSYLSISGISPAPTSLPVGQSGYWVVNAVDTRANYGSLSYSANWGDQSSALGQTASSFSHSYSSPGVYTITFMVTEVNTGLSVQSSVTVNVGGSNPVNTPATLSTDPSSPATNAVSVTNTTGGTYLGLPLLVFDLNPGNASANLKSLSVQILTPPPYGSQNVPALYLYQGPNLISSTAVSGSVATFNNINLNLQANVYTPLTIKADVAGLSQGELTTITANILSPEVSLQNSAGMIVPVTGSANGNTITVTNGNPTSTSGVSATLSLDASTPQTQSVNVTNTTQGQYLSLPVVVFDVSAQGGTLHLHNILADIVSSGNGFVNAAYLYQGSTLISSTAVTNNQANFSISDGTAGASIPVNTTVPYTIKVDVSGLSASGAQEAVGIESPIGPEFVIYNSADSAVTINGPVMSNTMQDGAINSNTITVVQ